MLRRMLLTLRPALDKGQGPYAVKLKGVENDIKEIQRRVNEKLGENYARSFSYYLYLS
jgi:hypothetical protein